MSEHDEDESNEDESNLVRDLRKQLKAAKKANDETAEELSKFRAEQRKASVADVLKERGAKPELSKFYTGEDTSKEAVTAWLTENAEIFGVPEAEAEQDPAVAEAARKIAQSSASAPSHKIGSIESQTEAIRNAKTPAEFAAALAASGLKTD